MLKSPPNEKTDVTEGNIKQPVDPLDNMCFEEIDECNVCGGPGKPEGHCDCNGNVMDDCGKCGGPGIPHGDCDCFGH